MSDEDFGIEIDSIIREGGLAPPTPSFREEDTPVMQLPAAADGESDTSSVNYDTKTSSRRLGRTSTKVKFAVALLGVSALALTIGLGVGIGTRNNDANGSSFSSSNIADFTLEECIAQEEEEFFKATQQEEDYTPIPTYHPTYHPTGSLEEEAAQDIDSLFSYDFVIESGFGDGGTLSNDFDSEDRDGAVHRVLRGGQHKDVPVAAAQASKKMTTPKLGSHEPRPMERKLEQCKALLAGWRGGSSKCGKSGGGSKSGKSGNTSKSSKTSGFGSKSGKSGSKSGKSGDLCTDEPTSSPTNAPTTRSPTTSPTNSPTTRSPADPPITRSPTTSPTNSPTTRSPTTSPTNSPTTRSPTTSPTTRPPTNLPTVGNNQPCTILDDEPHSNCDAAFPFCCHRGKKANKCGKQTESCKSGVASANACNAVELGFCMGKICCKTSNGSNPPNQQYECRDIGTSCP